MFIINQKDNNRFIGEPQCGQFWLSSQNEFHRLDGSTLRANEAVALVLRTITFNGEDWEDYGHLEYECRLQNTCDDTLILSGRDGKCASPPFFI